MSRAKTTLVLMVRWLVVLVASLVVSSGSGFASAPIKAKSSCTASCSKHCPCCISKSTPADSATPLAPASSTRTAVAKDFQLVALLGALLAPELGNLKSASFQFSAPHFPPCIPVFLRHCAFLI